MQNFSLHNHSMFSDGRNSVLDIAKFAVDIGLDAVGISDHFYSIENNLASYVENIKKVQHNVGIKVLIGAEVDLPDEAPDERIIHAWKALFGGRLLRTGRTDDRSVRAL